MSFSFSSIRYNWHRLLGTKTTMLDGVIVSTDKKDVPRSIRKFLFRETYEDVERQLVRKVVKPDSRVLEIGCGIGLVSLVARKLCPNGFVRSYEANPRMEDLIRKNYALNDLEPDLVMKAITADGKDLTFFVDDNILSSSSIDRGRGDTETTIQSEKFDTVLKELDPEVIIMDVEGAEVSLLNDSDLHNVKHIVAELHPHIVGKNAIDDLLEKLETKGFQNIETKGKVFLHSKSEAR